MNKESNQWSKEELQIYILLVCASADSNESIEEIHLIKSKTNTVTFNKIYTEFSKDNEDESLDKIENNIHKHEYSHLELSEFQKEIHTIFFADDNFNQMEKNLDRILNNILY